MPAAPDRGPRDYATNAEFPAPITGCVATVVSAVTVTERTVSLLAVCCIPNGPMISTDSARHQLLVGESGELYAALCRIRVAQDRFARGTQL